MTLPTKKGVPSPFEFFPELENLKVAVECDVCRKNTALGVCSSGFGAISLAYCKECLEKPADATFVFDAMFLGDLEETPEKYHESVFEWFTYKDGEYISVRDFYKWRVANPHPLPD